MGNRTGRIAVVGALLTAGALCLASSAQAAKLVASTQSATAGTQVTISVTLQTEGAMIAGTQNDLAFDATNIPVPRHCTKTANVMVTCSVDADCPPVNGVADTCSTKPACYVNPDIDKGATSFAYRGATGCSGPACGGLRSLVLSTGNVDPIPDGSVLYTCFVKVAATATGSFPLALSGIISSDPDGQPVASTGVNGAINLGGNTPIPTVTNTPAPVACIAPALQFDTVNADPGTQTTISLTLLAGTAMVAGTQNDFTFDPTNIPVPRHCTKTANVLVTCSVDADCPPVNGVADTCSTKPACYVNPDIDKGATSFAYRGATGCSGPACGGIRALVLSTGNVDPIPSGSVLYTCKVNVAATATGSFPLTLSGVILSDPDGQPVTPATGCNGAVNAGGNTPTPTPTGPVIDTATPTATRTATPTSQPSPPTSTPTRTNTPVPPTATRTNTPIVGPTTAPFSDDDGGCNISTTGSSSAGWLVLIPAVGLLVLRRRRR